MVYKRMSKTIRKPKKRFSKKKKHLKPNKPNKHNKFIKLRDPSHSFTAMCLGKCKRSIQTISDVKFYKNRNGSVRVAGICSKCGTKMNTFASGKLFM